MSVSLDSTAISPLQPELHITAEKGVIEAPCGAVKYDDRLHIFHQFRAKPHRGTRWAHSTASSLSYDWDFCDDVIAPQDKEVDCLGGSTLPVYDPETGKTTVELFFVSTTASPADTPREEVLGHRIPHDQRGHRSLTIQRAIIHDLDLLGESISDDARLLDPAVTRLGPINIDDSAHPVEALATPSVVPDPHTPGQWLMLALDLSSGTAADIILLSSQNRQDWVVQGTLTFSDQAEIPFSRPFAPRLTTLRDQSTGEDRDVLFITYQGDDEESAEVVGYLVGTLDSCFFHADTPFQIFDYGHDFTRPRITLGSDPMIIGLVGAAPTTDGTPWANCLSSPRWLTLDGGRLYQRIEGAPRAVSTFSDRALLWSAQLDVPSISPASSSSRPSPVAFQEGEALFKHEVRVSFYDTQKIKVVEVIHAGDHLSVLRYTPGGGTDIRTAPLGDVDSDTLTIFIDGPIIEVFADGGEVTMTSMLLSENPVTSMETDIHGDAHIDTALVSSGSRLSV